MNVLTYAIFDTAPRAREPLAERYACYRRGVDAAGRPYTKASTIAKGPTIDSVRSQLPPGLLPLPILPGELPGIVEEWI